MSKLRSKPPAASAEDFISEAEQRPEPSRKKKGRAAEQHPRKAPMVRDDTSKVYNVRLPQVYLLKLKYIPAHTFARQKRLLATLVLTLHSKIDCQALNVIRGP